MEFEETGTVSRTDRAPVTDKVVVIGAGPAGLTAASELCKAQIPSVVLEKDNVVGGISRTVSYKGYLFDIGGHRFFTKVQSVEKMWHEYMQDDFLLRNRESRILYNRKFFNYPLKISNALSGLGIRTSVMVLLSYCKIRLFPIRNERNFADFVTNMFGGRLYHIFFKTYTEKVWGIPCTEISAEWAAQRIKGLSLVSAVKNALIGNRFKTKQTVIKTLIDSFHYPRKGPGMMWEKVTTAVNNAGSEVRMDSDVVSVLHNDKRVTGVEVQGKDGTVEVIEGSDFISTMPIRELISKLKPAAPEHIRDAGDALNYRDFLTVALIIDEEHLFDDNWIYIHDSDVRVGRIQNFKNWSPEMVPDSSKTCLGLEYFCFEGDGLWTMSDDELIRLGSLEMEKLGFTKAADVVDGTVVRMPKAYPVYDEAYADALEVVKKYLKSDMPNMQLVGRNGMHKYNNQDHSMLTAMLAVENLQGAKHDLWSVNADQSYHEEVTEQEIAALEATESGVSGQAVDDDLVATLNATQPLVPQTIKLDSGSDVTTLTFAKLDKTSLALAIGIVAATLLFIFTLLLTILPAPELGEKVELLGQYFYAYSVSFKGAVLGAIYGFVIGFLFGWLLAYLRNTLFGWIWRRAVVDARTSSDTRPLDLV